MEDFPTRPQLHLRKTGTFATTPTGWVSSTGAVTTSIGANPNYYIEFLTANDSNTISVDVVGDSRFGGSSEFSADRAYRSFELYLHNALVGLGKYPFINRAGISGASIVGDNSTTDNNYWKCAIDNQSLPQPSKWLVYLIYSINNGSTVTRELADYAMAKAAHIASMARASGQRVLFVPAYPCGQNSALFDGASMTQIGRIQAFAENMGDAVFDPIAQYGTAAGQYSMYAYDDNHMTDAGYQAMAASVAALLVA